jgi:HAD superfamily hydrolase (TIGR01509 family)
VVSALLFDFDGVLLDTESAAYQSWCEVYAEFGVQLPLSTWVNEAVGRSAGATAFDPVAYLGEQLGAQVDREWVLHLRKEWKTRLAPATLLPGVSDLLREASTAGVPTAIVTSEYRDRVSAHLDRVGVTHIWDAIVCAEGDAERGKPSPTLYLDALDELNVAAGEAVAFEDSPNGVRAAKAAGILCVVVPNDITRGAPGLEEGDVMMDSLSGVTLGLLTEIQRRLARPSRTDR